MYVLYAKQQDISYYEYYEYEHTNIWAGRYDTKT